MTRSLETPSLISWQIKHVEEREQKAGAGSCSPRVASIWLPRTPKGKGGLCYQRQKQRR